MKKALFVFLLLFGARPAFAQTARKESGRAMTANGATFRANCWRSPKPLPRKILLAPRARRAFHKRSLHAYRHREFWLAGRDRSQNAADLKEGMEKSVTAKAEVINWLKRSLDAVKQAHLAVTRKDLERKVHIVDRDATVDGMYLRIIVHANEAHGPARRLRSHVRRPSSWSKNQ